MRSQLVFQCLVLFMAVGTVTSFGPLAKEGLGAMHDFFGGMKGTANSGMDAAGSMAGQGMDMFGSLFGGLGGMLQQIMGSWGSIFSQLLGGGGDIFGTLFNIVKSMIENFFSIFGSLTGSSRLQINKALHGSGTVFTTVMKMKLNPEKNQMKLKKEFLAVQKILESKHAHKDAMIKELKSKAPSLSAAVQTAFGHAHKVAQKHMKAFTPETTKGVKKMHAVINKAGFDFGSILQMIPTMMSGMSTMGDILGKGFNLITNLFNGFKMIFPI